MNNEGCKRSQIFFEYHVIQSRVQIHLALSAKVLGNTSSLFYDESKILKKFVSKKSNNQWWVNF